MSGPTAPGPLPVTTEDPGGRAATSATPVNPRKRRASNSASSLPTALASASSAAVAGAGPLASSAAAPAPETTAGKKKGRTNTPWTPEEEQKLQQMRGENKGWSEIAKVTRTPLFTQPPRVRSLIGEKVLPD